MTTKQPRKTAITQTNNGVLDNNGRTIVAHGTAPYALPPELDRAFITTWMMLKPGDPCFIGEIAKDFLDTTRRQLAEFCSSIGGPWHEWWATAALTWASVLNASGKWDLTDFTPIYRAQIDAGWALQVIIMLTGERFVVTPRGVCTLPEFQWQYGQDLIQYLRGQQALQIDLLDRVISHLISEAKTVWVRARAPDGQEVMHQITVLACQTVDDWAIPEGYQLIGLV